MTKTGRLILVIILAFTAVTFASVSFAFYSMTVQKWTEKGRSYAFETLDATLIWYATLLNDEVLNAQQALLDKKKINETIPRPDGVAFFLSLYSSKGVNSFNLEESSAWKIYLIGENGKETKPVSIQNVTVGAKERLFYPYLDQWSKAYVVTFPKIPLGKNPKLVIRSITAESVLDWKLK